MDWADLVEMVFMESRHENLLNLLDGLYRRGVRWRTVNGYFEVIEGREGLTEAENDACEAINHSLLMAHRIEREALFEETEDHVPATVERTLSCRIRGVPCRAFDYKQLRAMTPATVADRRRRRKSSECGECDLACVDIHHRIDRVKQLAKEARRIAAERANRFRHEIEAEPDTQDWEEVVEREE